MAEYESDHQADDAGDGILDLQNETARLQSEVAARAKIEEQLYAALAAEQLARQEAEAAIRQRDEFLSIAAHDLRTPLTVLYGHVQLVLRRLQRGGPVSPASITEAMQTVSEQADTLALLVNQLLDTSRLEFGKLIVDPQQADLSELVARVIKRHEHANERHTFTLTAPERMDVVVDPLRIEQVITNLLDNAIKYSPAGGLIAVTLAGRDDGGVELAIRDHGMGVPLEHRPRIFDRYYQVNGHGYRSGLGLGLYISRQIVEQHGGEIHADFPDDGGSRFVIVLPAEDSSAA